MEKLLFKVICCWLLLATASAQAFVLPQHANVGPGSYWVYQSNLGTARSEILARTAIPDGWHYRWRLSVMGLTYEEQLKLTATQLGVVERTFGAWRIYKDHFSFPQGELTLHVPLVVGSTWQWSGPVQYGKQTGTTQVLGQVVAVSEITVPAGTFQVMEIVLERSDTFGMQQHIQLWLHAEIGVIKAVGELHWTGLVGKIQNLVGFHHFAVELRSYAIVPPKQES